MIKYFSKEYGYADLCRRSANFGVFAGARRYAFTEGKSKGVEAVDIVTGGGLRYLVVPDRGLDIAAAEFKGVPLVYLSQTGIVAPQYYEAEGEQWLRSFTGGLLTTCGLRQVGNASVYEGERAGLHGRICNCPASNVCVWEGLDDAEYRISVKGKVSEAKACGENLMLTRKIVSYAGKNIIQIQDAIENRGYTKQPFMLLYHCNIGFPLINDNAQIVIPNRGVTSMYEGRELQMKRYQRIGPPIESTTEDVFYFDATPDPNGVVSIAVVNDKDDPQLALRIRYQKKTLDHLALWKQCSAGNYVVGIEPCNNEVRGVEYAAEHKQLKFIQPGETISTWLEFEVFEGEEIKMLL